MSRILSKLGLRSRVEVVAWDATPAEKSDLKGVIPDVLGRSGPTVIPGASLRAEKS